MPKCKLFLVSFLIATVLSGCFPDETPCHYFELVENTLKNNQWNVDSLHLYVYDSTSLYHLDTTYTNYGNIKFIFVNSYQQSNYNALYNTCNDNGNIIYTLPDSRKIDLGFTFGSYGPAGGENNLIYLSADTPLDGYPHFYYAESNIDVSNKVRIYQYEYTYWENYEYNLADSLRLNRYWEFTLSKK